MRDFVHVHDVARANLLAIDAVTERPAESWAAYNVCSGTPVPIVRVAELLSEAAGGPAPEVTGDYRAGDVRHVVASPELAAAELGFTAASIAPGAGHPGVRRPPVCSRHGALRTDAPSGTSSVLHASSAPARTAGAGRRAHQTWIATRATPALGQQRARDQQPRDERQPDPLDLGLAHPGQLGGQHHQAGRADQPATTRAASTPDVAGLPSERREAGPQHRPGAEGERGEVAPPPVRRRPVARDPCPVAVVQRRAAPPTTRTRRRRRPRRRRGPRAPPSGSGRQLRATTSTATASRPSSGRP